MCIIIILCYAMRVHEYLTTWRGCNSIFRPVKYRNPRSAGYLNVYDIFYRRKSSTALYILLTFNLQTVIMT